MASDVLVLDPTLTRQSPIESTDGSSRDQLAAMLTDLTEHKRRILLVLVEALAAAPVEFRPFPESMIRRIARMSDMTQAQRRREIDRVIALLHHAAAHKDDGR